MRITENDKLTLLFVLIMLMEVLIFFSYIGRETPSVAGIINPGSEGFQKTFFGQQEIVIPVHATYVLLIYTNCMTFCSFNFGFGLV